MNQLRSEDFNQRQRVGMFMPLSMTGEVFLQVIEARNGAGASNPGDAVTPASWRGCLPVTSIRVADLTVNAARVTAPPSIRGVVLRRRPPTSELEQMPTV